MLFRLAMRRYGRGGKKGLQRCRHGHRPIAFRLPLACRRLFRHLDFELWDRTNHSPIRMLQLSKQSRLQEVAQAIAAAARTGKMGDGKIFVYDVLEAIRIRNNDTGEIAL